MNADQQDSQIILSNIYFNMKHKTCFNFNSCCKEETNYLIMLDIFIRIAISQIKVGSRKKKNK